jgi:hypothetical protein
MEFVECDPYEIELCCTPKGNEKIVIENKLPSLSAFQTPTTLTRFAMHSYSLGKTENSP